MKRKILAITIASVLGLVGCGGGSGGDDKKVIPQPTGTDFSGTVNKGIISNGKVEVCDTFDAQGCNAQGNYYYETTTNSSGKYSISDAPLDKPILVAVSKKNTSTTMKCDVATCTDASGAQVNFGQTFVVKDGWQLKTILPAANSATSVVNVTSLTDIAAKQALEDAGSSPVTTQIANRAKDTVEDIFGLEGSITELGSVDLTDPAQTQGAAPEDINAALYSAAVMSSAIDTDKLLTNKGDVYEVSTSLLDVIADAEQLVDNGSGEPLVKVSEVSKKELADHKAEQTTGDSGFKDIDGDGELDPIEVTPQPPAQGVVQAAKSFINDVRTTYLSVQDNGDLKKGLTDFGNELDVIAPLIEEKDVELALTNVQTAVEAITDAYEAQKAAPENTTYNYRGFTVAVDGTTYSAQRDNTAENVESTKVVAVISKVSISEGDQTTAEIDLGITSIDSSVDNVQLIATNSSAKVVGFSGEATVLSVESVALNLPNTQLAFVDAKTKKSANFTGHIHFDVKGLAAAEVQNNLEADQQTEAKSGSFMLANIRFGGDLATGGDSVGVYVNLVADNSLGYIYAEESKIFNVCSSGSVLGWNCNNVDTTRTPETQDKFVKTYLTAQVSTNVQNALNNAIAASVKLEVNRSQYNVAQAKATVEYNGVDTIIEAPVGLYDNVVNSAIIVRNTTGAVATVSEYEENVAGEISINGKKVASIEEIKNGLVLVRYLDGSFESLF
ncbi:hypothetical protein [Photobacterium alginatilyticum]|uniref:Uncharacterized protein n=1 Tax=Photobacterium alginatilyticum TaxID=1775171 RepID=A0ABW9YGN4_9GAMM|nr:hypothetical protein [Photobacterium alginatilyticum]NBI52898.1 hypothetical protein [Photobacterium alginatilyticum]